MTRRQSHYTPQDLDCGDETGRAYWATEPNGRLIVFVHGFNGSATETWMQFPSMLQGARPCHGTDVVFYEYETLQKQLYLSGGLLRQFLGDLIADPAAVINNTLDPAAARPASSGRCFQGHG